MSKKVSDLIVASILTVPLMVLGVVAGEPVVVIGALIFFFIVLKHN